MQNNRIYSAASITDVINMLKQYRLSGVLTIRQASAPYGAEAQINVELGQPAQIRQGAHEEPVTNAILSRLLGWGMIYFTFYAIEPTLKLPPPHSSQPAQQPHPPVPTTTAQSPTVTRPLPVLPSQMVRDRTENYNIRPSSNNHTGGTPNTPFPDTQTGQKPPPDYSSMLLFNEPVPRLALEMAIASLTPTGKNYPIAQIPRYDRVIYLLINGRRTIADLAQLTKRTVDEVCNSLYRLKQQELIIIRL
ncbi:MAG TPA: hypothetical protein VKV40_22955 [Ktedonobacteraceae bacterium]|nr:hypothetical protein [Ktedonobacteraceae bacterium]